MMVSPVSPVSPFILFSADSLAALHATFITRGVHTGLYGVLLFVASHAVGQGEAKIIRVVCGPASVVICASISSGIADTLVFSSVGREDWNVRRRTALAGQAASLPRVVSIRRPREATALRVLMSRG